MITCPNCQHQIKNEVSLKGGKARWANTTPEERSASARKAAVTRWVNTKTKTEASN